MVEGRYPAGVILISDPLQRPSEHQRFKRRGAPAECSPHSTGVDDEGRPTSTQVRLPARDKLSAVSARGRCSISRGVPRLSSRPGRRSRQGRLRGPRRASPGRTAPRARLPRLLLGIGSVTAGDRSFLLSLGLGLPAKRGLLVGQRALALRSRPGPPLRCAVRRLAQGVPPTGVHGPHGSAAPAARSPLRLQPRWRRRHLRSTFSSWFVPRVVAGECAPVGRKHARNS